MPFHRSLRTSGGSIAVWTLYLVPLGLSHWATLKNLTVGLAVVCTSLIICAHIYNPGPTQEVAIINRVFGLVMLWVSTCFFQGRAVLRKRIVNYSAMGRLILTFHSRANFCASAI